MNLRKPTPLEYPFPFDTLFHTVDGMDKEGSCALAARMFLWLAHNYQNTNWMHTRAANAFLRCGDVVNCLRWIRKVNKIMPTVATLLIEGRAWKYAERYTRAIRCYSRAEQILRGECYWTKGKWESMSTRDARP